MVDVAAESAERKTIMTDATYLKAHRKASRPWGEKRMNPKPGLSRNDGDIRQGA